MQQEYNALIKKHINLKRNLPWNSEITFRNKEEINQITKQVEAGKWVIRQLMCPDVTIGWFHKHNSQSWATIPPTIGALPEVMMFQLPLYQAQTHSLSQTTTSIRRIEPIAFDLKLTTSSATDLLKSFISKHTLTVILFHWILSKWFSRQYQYQQVKPNK